MILTNKKKIVGTLVPLSAIMSSILSKKDQGTIAVGFPFLKWLKNTGQNGWVLLPLNETQLVKGSKSIHAPSPYKGYGVGLDPRYLSAGFKKCDKKFTTQNDYWLSDYVLFCALRDHFGTDDWREWDEDIRNHTEDGIKKWSVKLSKQIESYTQQQCLLHTAYQDLRYEAQRNKISLIGDLPFYVSLNSPLVWANQDLFELGPKGKLDVVSGVLWGHFNRQIWGHPLYKWGSAKQNKKIINLWMERVHYYSSLFDIARIDHVKGFFKYGVIDLADPGNDCYREGPGEPVLAQLLNYSKDIGLSVFVEDSGHYRLDKFLEAAKKHSLASMKIFRFAYNEKNKSLNDSYADISNYPENSIVYTTTHDTETLIEYLSLLTSKAKKLLAAHAGISYESDDKTLARSIRSEIIASPARLVIIPIQDWLLTKDRINVPGTEKELGDTNWKYELKIPVEELAIDF